MGRDVNTGTAGASRSPCFWLLRVGSGGDGEQAHLGRESKELGFGLASEMTCRKKFKREAF